MADEPRLQLIGWGPFRLPGEARRWAEAEERARNEHALASAPAARPAATPPASVSASVSASANGTAAPAATSAPEVDDRQPDSPAEAPEPVARRVMQPLTAQERQMVELLAEGSNVSAIAKDLSISTREVTSKLVTINRKTGRFDQAGFAELVAHLRLAESRAAASAAADPPRAAETD